MLYLYSTFEGTTSDNISALYNFTLLSKKAQDKRQEDRRWEYNRCLYIFSVYN